MEIFKGDLSLDFFVQIAGTTTNLFEEVKFFYCRISFLKCVLRVEELLVELLALLECAVFFNALNLFVSSVPFYTIRCIYGEMSHAHV